MTSHLAALLAVWFCVPALGGDIPATIKPDALVLRLSSGWWLRINRDGSGSYGFGALFERVRVAKGTYEFAGVLDEIKHVFHRKPKNVEEPYMAVSYLEKGSSSAEEYPAAIDQALLKKLFILARNNTVRPANEVEHAWHNKIEKFWRKNSPICPNKPDAGDGK